MTSRVPGPSCARLPGFSPWSPHTSPGPARRARLPPAPHTACLSTLCNSRPRSHGWADAAWCGSHRRLKSPGLLHTPWHRAEQPWEPSLLPRPGHLAPMSQGRDTGQTSKALRPVTTGGTEKRRLAAPQRRLAFPHGAEHHPGAPARGPQPCPRPPGV